MSLIERKKPGVPYSKLKNTLYDFCGFTRQKLFMWIGLEHLIWRPVFLKFAAKFKLISLKNQFQFFLSKAKKWSFSQISVARNN